MAAVAETAPQPRVAIPAPRLAMLTLTGAAAFVILLGLTSLFGDMTYQGGRALHGQYFELPGAGELLGYGLRLPFGIIADRTRRHWTPTLIRYGLNLLAIPLMAIAGRWEIAVGLLFLERIGKAIRNPSRDAMLSYATKTLGRGWGFGLHEILDRTGSLLGPLVITGIFLTNGGPKLEIGSYQFGYSVLFAPALIALGLLLTARFFFPRPRDLEVKTPQISTKGYGREFWWYVAAAGLVAAGYADFPLIAFHFKRLALVPE